ncbi:MAG: SCO family protein [Ardenticatenaceae bacterium]|nr:SCO family protein [Ardenticatenaceae bacterium]MCB8989740.1 SCO family protein [Ardenticatenaceae bacterium]MCB9002801.1 SCO family protein [Ardenticatenaceae bacterium]
MKRLVLLLLLFLLLVACGGEPQYFGTLWPGPQQATDFTLQSVAGPVSLSDFSGKVVLLYFGYTFCPDVCPSTMTDLAQVMQELGKDADEIQVIMVTVDPERDTPLQLADYVAHFDPSFIGLSGTEEQIAAAASDYGIFYERHEGTPATGYLIDHTARVFVIDKKGEYWLSFPFGMARDEMVSDLRNVLKSQ